jgi:hypothetical protein
MNDLQRRQVEETQYREIHAKQAWARANAEEVGKITHYSIESAKHARLHNLKEAVADLCDMQPTPANMVRPPRKVLRCPHALPHILGPACRMRHPPLPCTLQEMLHDLQKELAVALKDVESELEAMGGSVSDMVSVKSGMTGKSATTAKSAATARSAATTKTAASGKTAASSMAPAPAPQLATVPEA